MRPRVVRNTRISSHYGRMQTQTFPSWSKLANSLRRCRRYRVREGGSLGRLELGGAETSKAARVADAESAAHIGNDSAAVCETGLLSRAQGRGRESTLGYRIRTRGSRCIGVERRTPGEHTLNYNGTPSQESR